MKALGRLAAVGLGMAALATAALGPGAPGAAAATAQQADSFVESIGVNVHLGYRDTPYGEHLDLVEQRLAELGIRHVRTGFAPGSAEIDQGVRELGAHGVGTTLIMGTPAEPSGALPQMLGEIKGSLLGSVDALEGPNEWSTSGDPEWQPHLVAYQERLYREVKEDPALASLPVIGPSIVHNDQAKLGDLSSFLDYGNIHSYPEGGPPEEKLDYYLGRATLNSGAKPMMATETGYTNATAWTPSGKGENRPISESAAAVYTPRLFLGYWSRGLTRTFDYELVDEHPDPALGEREDHFGLLRNDLSMKPAAVATENLTSLLADPGPAFAPGSLEYTLAGGTAPVRSALLEKRDGSFYLALWRLESVWNPEAKEAIPAAIEPLEVTLPSGPLDYAVYEPTASEAPLAEGGPAQSIRVGVGPGVTILRLDPPPPPAPSPAPGSPSIGSPSTLPANAPPSAPAPRCTVPPLRGKALAGARQALRRAGCRPRAFAVGVRPGHDSVGAPPRVSRLVPKAGSSLPFGATVKVFFRRQSGR